MPFSLLVACHPTIFEYDFELVSVAEGYAVDPDDTSSNEPTWDHEAGFGINQTVYVPCDSTEGLLAEDIREVERGTWKVAGPYGGTRQYIQGSADQGASTTIATGASFVNDTVFSVVVGDCGSGTPIGEGVVPQGTAVLAMPRELLDNDPWSTPFRPPDADVRLEWVPFDEEGVFEALVKDSLSHNGSARKTFLEFDISVCTDPIEVAVPESSTVTWGWVTWVHVAGFVIHGEGTPCSVSGEGS